MFGRKKTTNEPEVDVVVESIPQEFYGGVNPVVKFKTTEKEVGVEKTSVLTVPEKKAWDKSVAAGGGSKLHLANLLTSPKFLLISAGILFVVFGAAAAVYYWQQTKTVTPAAVVNPVQNVIENIPVLGSEATTTPTTTISETTTTPVVEEVKQSIMDVPPTYPPTTLGESVDTDKDGITDVAEELFLTDLGAIDSDKDKYSDSHEIYNLYNPTGKEPEKIIDSGLVFEFVNPIFGYKLYYPKSWAVGNVDVNYRSVLFSTITGENIEVRAIEKDTPNENFADWFAKWAPTENMADLKPFVTVFKDKGWQRSDELVFYFETPNRVYTLIYHTTDSTVVNYKIVIKMMARSFRLPSSGESLPAPIIEESGVNANNVSATSSGI